MEKLRTILVFRVSSIGDIVQLTSPLQTLKDQFPNARLEILSSDTLKNFSKTKHIFNDIENGKIEILVGTQVVAK